MKYLNIFLFIAMCIFLVSCADVQQVEKCINGYEYGFWGGLWHGMIAPFSFVGSLFSDDIAFWAVNNNGNWYTFGFFLGIGGFCNSLRAIK